ncbi:NAD(P)/FAD-dependent oxidoreductase [Archaeoglobales archaeon]|nr:MAG: NAD(P)/FAD-dependent oxidoreductase [Archaeoglobales archaeon]
MRVAIIGSGLGGLLTAAILSEKGYKVDVFEKLRFYGGRFTNLEYKGFQISTGALHMIPHGKRGPLGILLKKAGSKVEIIDSEPEGEALYGPLSENEYGNGKNERITVRSSVFPLGSKLKFFKWLLKFKVLRVDPYMDRYEEELDDFSQKFLRSFLGWSLSIQPSEIKYSKLLAIYRNVVKYGGPGIPAGGCKAVVDSLAEIIKSNDGEIYLRNPVWGLFHEDKRITGLENKEGKVEYDLYISNIGHQATGKLLGEEYTKEVESRGIKYSISLEKPFVGHTGVLFTLDCRRISGMNEVTNADPNLAPSGKHLLMAHQPMLTPDVEEEIRIGLEDLKTLLKGFEYKVLAIQSYFDGWPVNRVRSGLDIGYRTPYSNLFVVGDGAKGDDIEVDGIALGIAELLRKEFGEKINLG